MRYDDIDWSQASCAGVWTPLFFLENSADAAVMTPVFRAMCDGCPILAECREYAIEHESHGFWGGLTVTERQALRARMRRAKRAA